MHQDIKRDALSLRKKISSFVNCIDTCSVYRPQMFSMASISAAIVHYYFENDLLVLKYLSRIFFIPTETFIHI